jgi:hypothetical protein
MYTPSQYLYYFNHTPAYTPNAEGDTAQEGAFHGSEVPFFWHVASELVGPGEIDLSTRMSTMLANFAWHGDPNGNNGESRANQGRGERAMAGNVAGGEGVGLPPVAPWLAYEPLTDPAGVFGQSITAPVDSPEFKHDFHIKKQLKSGLCDFWDEFYYNRTKI